MSMLVLVVLVAVMIVVMIGDCGGCGVDNDGSDDNYGRDGGVAMTTIRI